MSEWPLAHLVRHQLRREAWPTLLLAIGCHSKFFLLRPRSRQNLEHARNHCGRKQNKIQLYACLFCAFRL